MFIINFKYLKAMKKIFISISMVAVFATGLFMNFSICGKKTAEDVKLSGLSTEANAACEYNIDAYGKCLSLTDYCVHSTSDHECDPTY
jgi:hypothetical protein